MAVCQECMIEVCFLILHVRCVWFSIGMLQSGRHRGWDSAFYDLACYWGDDSMHTHCHFSEIGGTASCDASVNLIGETSYCGHQTGGYYTIKHTVEPWPTCLGDKYYIQISESLESCTYHVIVKKHYHTHLWQHYQRVILINFNTRHTSVTFCTSHSVLSPFHPWCHN